MAYAALFSLAQTTNQILNDDRFPISDNGKHQITSLLEHLSFLQEFLEKFPNEASSLEVRIRHTANEAEDHLERLMYYQIQSLLNTTKITSLLPCPEEFLEMFSNEVSIRHAANEAEDHLERLMYDQIRSHHMEKIYDGPYDYDEVIKRRRISKEAADFKSLNTTKITSLLPCPEEFLEMFSNEVSIRHAANEAEDHLERLMYDQIQSHHMEKIYDGPYDFDEVIKEVAEKINSISKEAADFKSLNTTETVVLGDAPTVKSLPVVGGVTVGLDDDLVKIKDLLCGMSSKLEVIPIVGMGGIGKTTLAMKAYHDQLIMESFHVRAWVTISQDYKPQNIFADLLDFCKGVGDEGSGKSNDFAKDKVYKFLKGRKYLIVLDDMWSTKAWDEVKRIFPDDGNGSRILLTTRIEDVGSYADSCNYLYQMKFMKPDRSWDLLKQKVFPDKDCPPELEDIGKHIATSCGGLPLAIVLVAGILSSVDETQTRVMWLEVAKKVRLAIDGEDGHFEKIISLSYTHLPHHLRPCFLYMGGLPEDYEIRVSKLTKLWVAGGFVEPRDGKSLEERAEEYLEDIVKRSLALVKKRKSNGKIKSCSVHDLVRDICKRKAMEEDYHRRLSIDHHDLMSLARTLRSVICFQPSERSLRPLKVLRLLRVLDLGNTYINSFPDRVFDLFHLRYLGFTLNSNLKIPATISRLRNLRTLIVYHMMGKTSGLHYELCLPFEICMIPLLRHLVSWCPLLLDTEGVKVGTFTKLEKLVTLSLVKRFICTTKVIEMIPNIKKLGIIIHSGEEDDYHLHNLVLLSQLEKFKLVVEGDTSAWPKVNPVFPQTLKKLVLNGCGFPWKYMEVVGSLPNLRVLKIRNHGCEGGTWETNEEQFPNLEFLWIDWCDLKKWVTERSHFPRLERLVLLHCFELKEIPDDIGEIPTLKLIEVDDCNESLVKCAIRIREEQHDNGNHGLEVEVRYNYDNKSKEYFQAHNMKLGKYTEAHFTRMLDEEVELMVKNLHEDAWGGGSRG